MKARNIVIGQKVDSIKVQRAKELRRRMTPEEEMLWKALRANRLGGLHFRRQQIISGFIVDFYCHAAKVIVEVDGTVHERQAQADRERDQILTAKGFSVLRFTNDEIRENFTEVLAKIMNACHKSSPPRVGEGLGERS
jgi:very-short-patch-repair endonuclease